MKTYPKGQKFLRKVDSTLWVLALIGTQVSLKHTFGEGASPFHDDPALMCLISINNGDRYTNASFVKDCMRVTEEEFKEISGSGDFQVAYFASDVVPVKTQKTINAKVK